MQIALTGQQWIAGKPVTSDGLPFYSPRPLDKSQGTQVFHNASSAIVDQAVVAAQAAYEETRLYTAARLAEFLACVAQEIEALGDDLFQITQLETGLGLPRLTGELGRTTGQLRKFAALLHDGAYVGAIIDTAQPTRQPLPRPSIRRMLAPLGVVGVFSASNFPYAFSVAGGDTASAFAAGCPVIVKAHPGHPETSEWIAIAINRAIETCGFPSGFFSLIQGDQIAVGQALVTHPEVSAIGFTGSFRAGRAIFDAASARAKPIPVFAEMGSINPMVILPEAIGVRGETLAVDLSKSITLGTGQFCTNPGLIFVIDSPTTQKFIEQVVSAMSNTAAGVLLNQQIQNGLSQAVAATLSIDGVNKLLGGHVPDASACTYAHTVLTTSSSTFRQEAGLQAEHFGPVTLFVICDDFEDLIASLNVLEGNLTASIHAEAAELAAGRELLNLLREKVGRLIWNGFPTGVEVVHAMQHGGPYPATTAAHTTSVGMTAIQRFMRPVAYQDVPDELLPPALQDANPLGIWRLVDEQWTQDSIHESK